MAPTAFYVLALLAAAFVLPALIFRLLEPLRSRGAALAREAEVCCAHPEPTLPSMLIVGLLAAGWFYRDRAEDPSQLVEVIIAIVFLGILLNSWFAYAMLTSNHLRFRRSLLSHVVELALAELGTVAAGTGLRSQSVSVTDAHGKRYQLGRLPTGREFARRLESAIREAPRPVA